MDSFQDWICLGILCCDWTMCNPIILFYHPNYFFGKFGARSRIISLGHGYLDNQVCAILFAITSTDLVLIAVISNQPVAVLIMVMHATSLFGCLVVWRNTDQWDQCRVFSTVWLQLLWLLSVRIWLFFFWLIDTCDKWSIFFNCRRQSVPNKMLANG